MHCLGVGQSFFRSDVVLFMMHIRRSYNNCFAKTDASEVRPDETAAGPQPVNRPELS